MSIETNNRIKALEAKVAELDRLIQELAKVRGQRGKNA